MLTKDEILKKQDLAEEEIEVKEWGGKVKIRAMSMKQRNAIYKGASNASGNIDNEKLVMLTFIECVIEPKFDLKDYEILANKSGAPIQKIVSKIMELSGFNTELKNG